MSELSLIELVVYGFVCYTGVLMLTISVIREPPFKKRSSAVRVVFLIPSIFAAFILMNSGVDINLINNVTTTTTTDLNTTETWQEQKTENSLIELENPVWVTFHGMLFIVMIVFVIIQITSMFAQKE